MVKVLPNCPGLSGIYPQTPAGKRLTADRRQVDLNSCLSVTYDNTRRATRTGLEPATTGSTVALRREPNHSCFLRILAIITLHWSLAIVARSITTYQQMAVVRIAQTGKYRFAFFLFQPSIDHDSHLNSVRLPTSSQMR